MTTYHQHIKSLSIAALLLQAFVAHAVVYAAPVAEVIFVVGDAHVVGVDAPLKRGAMLTAGQTITTGANGHAHLRFIDQAFISVRPDSELRIEQYLYDAETPANNRIKLMLVQGTSRLITGQAGQAAKQNFRLNTPVAAIGVRGTDFLVQVEADITRVAVQQGAVVVSAFGSDCSPQALGPCGGDLALDLLGSASGRYLEVKAQTPPALITPEQGSRKRPFSLSHPEEPAVKASLSKTTAAPAALQTGSLVWGRWTATASTPPGYELLGKNDAFVLYRPQNELTLPSLGSINFTVSDAQGYARSSDGALNAAQITAPSLAVNFATMQYATQFNWTAAGQTLQLNNKGDVTASGHFQANPAASNMTISGGLNSAGDEAAYLFIKRLPGDDAYGVINWTK